MVEGDGISRRLDTAEDQVRVRSDGGAAHTQQGGRQRGNCKRRNCTVAYKGRWSAADRPNIHIMDPTGDRERREKEVFKEIIWVYFT